MDATSFYSDGVFKNILYNNVAHEWLLHNNSEGDLPHPGQHFGSFLFRLNLRPVEKKAERKRANSNAVVADTLVREHCHYPPSGLQSSRPHPAPAPPSSHLNPPHQHPEPSAHPRSQIQSHPHLQQNSLTRKHRRTSSPVRPHINSPHDNSVSPKTTSSSGTWNSDPNLNDKNNIYNKNSNKNDNNTIGLQQQQQNDNHKHFANIEVDQDSSNVSANASPSNDSTDDDPNIVRLKKDQLYPKNKFLPENRLSTSLLVAINYIAEGFILATCYENEKYNDTGFSLPNSQLLQHQKQDNEVLCRKLVMPLNRQECIILTRYMNGNVLFYSVASEPDDSSICLKSYSFKSLPDLSRFMYRKYNPSGPTDPLFFLKSTMILFRQCIECAIHQNFCDFDLHLTDKCLSKLASSNSADFFNIVHTIETLANGTFYAATVFDILSPNSSRVNTTKMGCFADTFCAYGAIPIYEFAKRQKEICQRFSSVQFTPYMPNEQDWGQSLNGALLHLPLKLAFYTAFPNARKLDHTERDLAKMRKGTKKSSVKNRLKQDGTDVDIEYDVNNQNYRNTSVEEAAPLGSSRGSSGNRIRNDPISASLDGPNNQSANDPNTGSPNDPDSASPKDPLSIEDPKWTVAHMALIQDGAKIRQQDHHLLQPQTGTSNNYEHWYGLGHGLGYGLGYGLEYGQAGPSNLQLTNNIEAAQADPVSTKKKKKKRAYRNNNNSWSSTTSTATRSYGYNNNNNNNINNNNNNNNNNSNKASNAIINKRRNGYEDIIINNDNNSNDNNNNNNNDYHEDNNNNDNDNIKNKNEKVLVPRGSHSGGKTSRVCSLCNRSFNRPADLRRHIATVHEKKRPHTCSQCQATFQMKWHLEDHIKVVHEKLREYKCHNCGLSFGRIGDCNKHKRRCGVQ